MEEHRLNVGLQNFLKQTLEKALASSVEKFVIRTEPVSGGATGAEPQRYRFEYLLSGGTRGEISIFGKRCVWHGRPESPHYGYLTRHGVPVPVVYGATRDETGLELIFMEWLDGTGGGCADDDFWLSFLTLLAQVNACPIEAGYEGQLSTFEQAGAVDGGGWITGVPTWPSDEELAGAFHLLHAEAPEIAILLAASRALFARVDAQPTGLLHQDFFPDNLGWRGNERVVFDLHKLAQGPRFGDLAGWLGEPDWSDRASFLAENGRRERFVRHYLYELQRFGGPMVPVDQCREEMRDLNWAHKVSCLQCLAENGRQSIALSGVEFLRSVKRETPGTLIDRLPNSRTLTHPDPHAP